ncbi:MAG: PIG-L family deacetylase [Gammaproteobacteria bacterium]|nr:MAG: PIG-L family deacetylase [Gammaproteobacteria bacterium]
MTTVLVIAPHPDDETFGCGGALLRHNAEGASVDWLIVTDISPRIGYSIRQVRQREREIQKVAKLYPFRGVYRLKLPTTRLDTLPLAKIVQGIGDVITRVKPEILYLPFAGDAHSDHRVVFAAAAACTKWFRYPWIRRVLAYETVSETDFGMHQTPVFHPNVFVDISAHLSKKIAIAKTYAGEVRDAPFPRSGGAIQALATLRGVRSGFQAAEAFMLLSEQQPA